MSKFEENYAKAKAEQDAKREAKLAKLSPEEREKLEKKPILISSIITAVLLGAVLWWFSSMAFGAVLATVGLITAIVGLITIIKPIKVLRIPTRKIASLVLVGGLAVVVTGFSVGGYDDKISAEEAGYSSVEEYKAAIKAEEERIAAAKKAEENRPAESDAEKWAGKVFRAGFKCDAKGISVVHKDRYACVRSYTGAP